MATTQQLDFTEDHYNAVAANYDEHFAELHNQMFQCVIENVDFHRDHKIADIGSGTGYLAEKLFTFFNLNNPIVCVEPNKQMQLRAERREGVDPVLKTGEDFFNDVSVHGCFDRVMMIQSDHHFADPKKIFEGVNQSLRADGICAILHIKSNSCYSLFREVTGAKMYPNERSENTSRMLEEANFKVKTSSFEGQDNLRKAKFYSMLRGRFITNLYSMSDDQIEEGIRKLEQGKLGFIENDDLIENRVRFVFLAAKKLPNI